ncbi:MAG: SRPBCC family protein [Thermoplasmata archaeon]
MVVYEEEVLISAPRDVVWRLLNDHLDDKKILTIHPLIQSQTTVSRTASETVVDRVIDVRRKMMKSRWKIAYQPPDRARWEIVESDGPWTKGSYVDVSYAEVPGGTQVRARGDLTISVLPFFLSQKRTVARVQNDIHIEDLSFLNRYRF